MIMEYINPQFMLLVANMTKFQKEHYNMYSFNYVSHYLDELITNEEPCFRPIIYFLLFSLIYFVTAHIVLACFMYDDKTSSNQKQETQDTLEEFINGVSCVKVPKVFSMVAKEHFKTETNMYLTYAGKLSLGRYLASKVERVDKTQKYLTQKDPMTKKVFQFLRYTTQDIDNMKTETKNWIIKNETNWVSYIAY